MACGQTATQLLCGGRETQHKEAVGLADCVVCAVGLCGPQPGALHVQLTSRVMLQVAQKFAVTVSEAVVVVLFVFKEY